MGGFECSMHRRPSGRRVDVIDATRHDHFAAPDYARLAAAGLLTARDGLRWPLIERVPGTYDFASAASQLEGSRVAGVEVIWDLLHYGVPDHVDVFSPDFPARFAAFAAACTTFLMAGTTGALWLCPINEISFFAWGGGEVAYLPPFVRGQGDRLKRALVRAVLEGMDAVRAVAPQVRFIHAEPLIEVSVHPERPHEEHDARIIRGSQFEALDMLAGRISPELGGDPRYIDVIGVNYYPYNQWHHHPDQQQRAVLPPTSVLYTPLRRLLAEVAARYGRPLLIAETGSEDDARAPWFAMVAREALAARDAGVPVQGVCLYPVVNHPGWDDDRHCHNGLWDYPDAAGNRGAYEPLAHALNEARTWEARTRETKARPEQGTPVSWQGGLSRAADVIAAEAEANGADGAVPAASIAALRETGLLSAPLPVASGGAGLGGTELLKVIRRLGRADLNMARLYGDHAAALLLVAGYGERWQLDTLADDVADGHLAGVWTTETGQVPRLERTAQGWTLYGAADSTSMRPAVTRSVVSAALPEGGGRQLLLVPAAQSGAPFWTTQTSWVTQARLAPDCSDLSLGGLEVSEADILGTPYASATSPDAGAGTLRLLAAQLGSADALVELARTQLTAAGHADTLQTDTLRTDAVQALRFADLAGRLEGAWQVVQRAEQLTTLVTVQTDPAPLLAYVALARSMTEEACLLVAEFTERTVSTKELSIGAFPESAPGSGRVRELRLSMRQHASDADRVQAGMWLLGRNPLGSDESSLWPEESP